MFQYEIYFPPPEQVEIRRRQLDRAGFLGWLSPIIFLVTVYVGRLLLAQTPGADTNKKPPSTLQALWRRSIWTLNNVYLPEFGPLYIQAIATIHLAWLLYLVFWNTGIDYLHLTKAFGHVAVSQLPLHYLLAFKSPRSPIALATGLTHERLNAYHRALGRIIHALLAAHVALYLGFFLVKDLLAKRMQGRDVQLGIIAFWSFNFLGLLALPVARRKAYHKLFYRSHVVLSAAIPISLFFHVPYTRRYLLQAGVFWLANGILRAGASENVKIKCEKVKDTQLIKVTFEVNKQSQLRNWVPGQHVYLRRGALGPRTPFTIVRSSGHHEGNMELVVRNLSGPQTSFLGQTATSGEVSKGLIEGPYGEAGEYLPALLEQGRRAGPAVVVAGGVGATFALPVYMALVEARGDSVGVKLLWFVKSLQDAAWGIEIIQHMEQVTDVEIYVTGKSKSSGVNVKSNVSKGVKVFELGSRPNLKTVIDPVMTPKNDQDVNGTLTTNGKRDPRKLKQSHEKITFFVCGPPTLSQSVRAEVGRHVIGYGRRTVWHEEQFGLGGS